MSGCFHVPPGRGRKGQEGESALAKAEGEKWGWYLLVTHVLLGAIFFVAMTLYPTSPKVALTLIYLLVMGLLYCGVKGIKGLWNKD